MVKAIKILRTANTKKYTKSTINQTVLIKMYQFVSSTLIVCSTMIMCVVFHTFVPLSVMLNMDSSLLF